MTTFSVALAESILHRFPDPDSIPYQPWCYVQGFVLCGFEKLWSYTGERRYFDYIKTFVDQHVTAAGAIRDFSGDSLDDIMAGTAIVAVYEQTGEQKYRRAAERVRAAFEDYPRNSDGGFWHARRLPSEMWIDGVFMGQMFLTRYGAAIDERDYCFDEAARQIVCLARHCHKDDSGLFVHAYDESRTVAWADPISGLSPEVWSEGLGWYALVLVETLTLMPADHPRRTEVMKICQGLLEGLRRTQDPRTGLWYQVVDKGERPDNWHDSSGSAMFIYAIQRAIDLGYVRAEQYGPVVQRGYAGLRTKMAIDAHGLVDIHDACDGVCVQRSYEDYVHYPKQINAKEAVGACLWATGIVEKPVSWKV
jgi:rhamnogalacturonyl hydrolase YesR